MFHVSVPLLVTHTKAFDSVQLPNRSAAQRGTSSSVPGSGSSDPATQLPGMRLAVIAAVGSMAEGLASGWRGLSNCGGVDRRQQLLLLLATRQRVSCNARRRGEQVIGHVAAVVHFRWRIFPADPRAEPIGSLCRGAFRLFLRLIELVRLKESL